MITAAVALVTQLNSIRVLVCLSPSLFADMVLFLFSQSIMNRLWLGMNLTDAIAAPIVYVDSSNNVIFEPGFSKVSHVLFH